MLAVNFINLMPLISLLPARLEYTISSYYLENHNLSLTALANRGLFMLIVFFLALRAKDELSRHEKFLFNLYAVGFCVYVVFMSFDLIASRTNVYFRIVEIALIPALFARNRDFVRRLRVAFPAMLLLLAFLYVKDITAVMDYSEYYRCLEFIRENELELDGDIMLRAVSFRNYDVAYYDFWAPIK